MEHLIIAVICLVNLGLTFYLFNVVKGLKQHMTRDYFCRYPDSNIRDVIIDHELEKVNKLEHILHDLEEKSKKSNQS